MNATRLVKTRGQPVFHESEKGVEGSEPGVARPSRVSAVRLDVFEEGKDKRCVELFDLEPIRSDPEPVRREANQDAEAVSVGFAGVRAGPRGFDAVKSDNEGVALRSRAASGTSPSIRLACQSNARSRRPTCRIVTR